MKVLCYNNECILFIGAYPTYPNRYKNEQLKLYGYCDEDSLKHLIEFENQDLTYLKSNKVCTIWTFRQLLKWRRLLPKDDNWRVLEKTFNGWKRVKKVTK